jgi:hypothetical protein
MKEQTDLNWPIRLALDTVLPTLDSMHASYQNLDLLKMGASTPLTLNQSLEFVTTKLQQLNGWLSMTSNLITDSLMDAWNLQDGYEKEIETTRVAHRIVAASRALYDWEVSIASVLPPAESQELFTNLYGTTASLQKDLYSLFKDIAFVLSHEEIHGEMEIRNPFHTPTNLKELNRILETYLTTGNKAVLKQTTYSSKMTG